jgi:cholest-4-en-3-one 26-monooxygenase
MNADFSDVDAYMNDPFAFRNGVPHAMFKRLRDEDPVHWTPGRFGQGFWSLTRRSDIEAILLDTEGHSSQIKGNHLPESPLISQLMETAPEVLGCGALLPRLDAPWHRKLRMVFDRSISPRMVASFEPRVRNIVIDTIEAAKARGRYDFVTGGAKVIERLCRLREGQP